MRPAVEHCGLMRFITATLLRALPHKDGGRLMYLRHSAQGPGTENGLFSVPEITDFRASSKTLGGIAEYSPMTFSLLGDDDVVRIDVGLVTGNYFAVMGLSPVLGRAFVEGDDGPGAAPVMMLTHAYWLSRFGGVSAILGESVRVCGRAVVVVKGAAARAMFPARIDALMNMVKRAPLSAMMVTGRTHRMTEMIASWPRATVARRAPRSRSSPASAADHPESYDAASGYRVTLTPFQEVLGQRARLHPLAPDEGRGVVLIIACANVANLCSCAECAGTTRWWCARAALGASTGRLRRLLLASSCWRWSAAPRSRLGLWRREDADRLRRDTATRARIRSVVLLTVPAC